MRVCTHSPSKTASCEDVFSLLLRTWRAAVWWRSPGGRTRTVRAYRACMPRIRRWLSDGCAHGCARKRSNYRQSGAGAPVAPVVVGCPGFLVRAPVGVLGDTADGWKVETVHGLSTSCGQSVRSARTAGQDWASRGWCFLGSMMSALCSSTAHWWGADPATVTAVFCLRRAPWGIPTSSALPPISGRRVRPAARRGRQQAGIRANSLCSGVDRVDQPQQVACVRQKVDSDPGQPALVLDLAVKQDVDLLVTSLAALAGGVAGDTDVQDEHRGVLQVGHGRVLAAGQRSGAGPGRLGPGLAVLASCYGCWSSYAYVSSVAPF